MAKDFRSGRPMTPRATPHWNSAITSSCNTASIKRRSISSIATSLRNGWDKRAATELLAFFLAHVQLADHLAMILQNAISPDLHGRSQLAGLDSELALDHSELADLLEGRELLVHARHGLLHLGQHGL